MAKPLFKKQVETSALRIGHESLGRDWLCLGESGVDAFTSMRIAGHSSVTIS